MAAEPQNSGQSGRRQFAVGEVHDRERLAVGQAERPAERDPEPADRDVAAVQQLQHVFGAERRVVQQLRHVTGQATARSGDRDGTR
jgi:hypothetical protein